MIQLLKEFYVPVLITFVGGWLVVIATKYFTAKHPSRPAAPFRVLWYYRADKPTRTLIQTLGLIILSNLLASVVIYFCEQPESERSFASALTHLVLNSTVFGFFYFLGFGVLAVALQEAIGSERQASFVLATGHTVGAVAASLVFPLQTVGFAISQLGGPSTVIDLQNLRFFSLLSFWGHGFTTAFGYGLLLESLFANVGNFESPLAQIKRNDHRIIVLLLLIGGFGSAFAAWVHPASIFAKALLYENTFLIWFGLSVVVSVSYLFSSKLIWPHVCARCLVSLEGCR